MGRQMEIKSFEIKDSAVSIGERTFEGYASTFDLDQDDDIIHQGSFQKSIKESFPAGRIKVLWQHESPIGLPIEMSEDSRGLYVRAKVSKTRLGDEALELMSDRVVDRMSIGFSIPKGKFEYDEKGIRHIREVKLFEFSPVTFPANESAIITGVKSIRDAILRGAQIKHSAELTEALNDLTALIAKLEPVSSTPATPEPPDLSEFEALANSLGDLARTLNV